MAGAPRPQDYQREETTVREIPISTGINRRPELEQQKQVSGKPAKPVRWRRRQPFNKERKASHPTEEKDDFYL